MTDVSLVLGCEATGKPNHCGEAKGSTCQGRVLGGGPSSGPVSVGVKREPCSLLSRTPSSSEESFVLSFEVSP